MTTPTDIIMEPFLGLIEDKTKEEILAISDFLNDEAYARFPTYDTVFSPQS